MSEILLKDRVEFEYGYSVRVNDEKHGEYPVFGSNGITGFIDSYKVKGPGVIIGRKGSVGAIKFSEENFTPTDTAYYLSIKDIKKDDIKFWFYYLQLLGLEKLNTHSSVPGLSREIAYFINVNPPDLATQKKISAVLSALDAKIELNTRINAELESLAKTLYDYWFVQFAPHKSAGGEMVWNEELKREIPLGWEVVKLGDCFEVKKGSLITEKTKENGLIKVVAGGLDFAYYHSEFNRDENTVTISGSGANAGFVNFWREKIFASDCTTVRGATDVETIIVYYYLKLMQKQIYRYSQGSAQPHVYPTDIKNLPYIYAPRKIYDLVEPLLIPLNKKIAQNELESQSLREMRDWLLPMLMNGQVKVA